MPCHPRRAGEAGTLAAALLARYPELKGVGSSPREPGLVHRLDTDTSGLLLVARAQPVFLSLRAALRAGAIDKRYRALCAGHVRSPARHHGHLRAHGAKVRVRAEPFPEAVAITTEVLESTPRGALSAVEVRAHVARRHQVRAHLAALGHALAGDALYGGPALPGLGRHFLHASALALRHPTSERELRVESPLPPELAAIERALSSSER
jgi:23S rRNA pseudouridine1911/1915/1917 synthase